MTVGFEADKIRDEFPECDAELGVEGCPRGKVEVVEVLDPILLGLGEARVVDERLQKTDQLVETRGSTQRHDSLDVGVREEREMPKDALDVPMRVEGALDEVEDGHPVLPLDLHDRRPEVA